MRCAAKPKAPCNTLFLFENIPGVSRASGEGAAPPNPSLNSPDTSNMQTVISTVEHDNAPPHPPPQTEWESRPETTRPHQPAPTPLNTPPHKTPTHTSPPQTPPPPASAHRCAHRHSSPPRQSFCGCSRSPGTTVSVPPPQACPARYPAHASSTQPSQSPQSSPPPYNKPPNLRPTPNQKTPICIF